MARRASRAPGSSSSSARMSAAAARRSPATTRSTKPPTPAFATGLRSALLGRRAQELARDHHLLDLVGPLADLGQLGVAQVALDVELAGVAVAAVDLHGGVAGADGRPRRVVLGDRRFLGGALSLILHPGGAPDEQARGVQLGRHVGQHVLDRLELAERLAELHPLLGVAARSLERRAPDADRPGADADAPLVENLQRVEEAVVDVAQALLVTDSNVLEDELCRVGGAQPHLVDLLAGAKAGHPALDDERGQALGLLL